MSPAKKPASRSSAKKPTAKKPQAKKTAVKKTAAKAGAKKTVAKTGGKKTTAKKPAPKKTRAKKASVKKAVANKTAAKKAPARSAAPKTAAKSTAKRATRPPAAARTAPKTPAPRPPRPLKLDKKALAAVRAELKTEVVELERQQAELEENSFVGTQSDMTGEVGLDEDFADAGTATFERERDLSIRNNIRDLIDQITRAIGRIDEGKYGTCERCGRPIDAARLKALPHALMCMDCKRREERAR